MSPQIVKCQSGIDVAQTSIPELRNINRNWFAVFTLPQNEKSVVRHLTAREVESFLPTYETVWVWKNRQRVRTAQPLFPGYLFVHIDNRERGRVLESPGVINIVGSSRGHGTVPDSAIELLRSGVENKNLELCSELVVGQAVRIRTGAMRGLQGILVQKGNGLRFVLAIEMIHKHVSIEIGAQNLEPVLVQCR